MTFPGRILGYYAVGSYIDGTAVSTSDIDMGVVFYGDHLAGEVERFQQLIGYCRSLCPIKLDIVTRSEHQLTIEHDYGAGFKFASTILYGVEIRDRMPPPPIEQYTFNVASGAFGVMQFIRQTDQPLTFPLDYPNPDDEFYGYLFPVQTPSGDKLPGTQQILNNVLVGASATLAINGGHYMGQKSKIVPAYAEHIGDSWAAYFTAFYDLCRTHWEYLLPEDQADRHRLKAILRQTLDYENHYLKNVYRDYLLTNAHIGPEPIRVKCIEQLGRMIFPGDQAIHDLLQKLTSESGDVGNAAQQSLSVITG